MVYDFWYPWDCLKYILQNFYQKTLGPYEVILGAILVGCIATALTGWNIINWAKQATGLDFWQTVKEGGDRVSEENREGMSARRSKMARKAQTTTFHGRKTPHP